MPKKKRRKRIRRRPLPLSKRLAELPFVPRSPDGLQKAIACFGPLPTPHISAPRGVPPFDFEFQGVDRIKNAKMAESLCETIGRSYSLALGLQRTRLKPAEAIENLKLAKDAAANCANALANLGPQERLMLHVFEDFSPGLELDTLVHQYNKTPAEDLPDISQRDGKLEPGSLADSLQEVSLYLEMLIEARRIQLRKRRTGKGGLKIRRTAAGLFASPPEWALIDQSWRLFNKVGLKPSATIDGPVHQFAKNIHRWVIGRQDGLDAHFKKYATCRLQLDRHLAELTALAHILKKSRRGLEIDCEHDQRKGISDRTFRTAKVLWGKIQELEDTAFYGP